MVQISHLYMTPRKTIALTIWTLVGKVMPLLLNTLSRFVIFFHPNSKCLLFHGCSHHLQWSPRKYSHCFHFSSSIWRDVRADQREHRACGLVPGLLLLKQWPMDFNCGLYEWEQWNFNLSLFSPLSLSWFQEMAEERTLKCRKKSGWVWGHVPSSLWASLHSISMKGGKGV